MPIYCLARYRFNVITTPDPACRVAEVSGKLRERLSLSQKRGRVGRSGGIDLEDLRGGTPSDVNTRTRLSTERQPLVSLKVSINIPMPSTVKHTWPTLNFLPYENSHVSFRLERSHILGVVPSCRHIALHNSLVPPCRRPSQAAQNQGPTLGSRHKFVEAS